MRIRKLSIDHFRGIGQLEWDVGTDCVCLVGPGDSTKTTILDAIELALSPRWNVQFDDTDFYQADTSKLIVVTVTIGDLPDEFKSDARYGYLTRGWSAHGQLHDEPEDGDELVLSVELRVGKSLEPSWTVVTDRDFEGREIGRRDREKIGCVRITDYVDRQLSWSRGSVLSRMTEKTEKTDDLASILAEAARAACSVVDGLHSGAMESLCAAARRAREAGAELGVASSCEFTPGLDSQAASITSGALTLHEAGVPLRRAGLGTRRLLSIAIQRKIADGGGIALLDEVEHGLEPHRIRHLVRRLRGDGISAGQVVMTTHAPVVIEELEPEQLRVVRSSAGVTQVLSVDASLKPVLRKASAAFLARKILVCEGMTELGLSRRLDDHWSEKGKSFSLSGVALVDGRGEEAARIAMGLVGLGYDVALFCDSDKPLNPDQTALRAAGVMVLQWDGDVALEERVAADLPWDGTAQMVEFAIGEYREQSVRDAIRNRLGDGMPLPDGSPAGWLGQGIDEAELRGAIGRAAKQHAVGNGRKGWFKRVDLAEALGEIIIGHLATVSNTDLARKITALKEWSGANG